MENDKPARGNVGGEEAPDATSETASRARNRTVMLTPEITGQVRARLAQEVPEAPSHAPSSSSARGFESPSRILSPSGGRAPSHEIPSHARPGPTIGQVAPAPQREGIVWAKESPLVGFMVSFDRNKNGESFELRVGRLTVTAKNQGEPNTFVILDESVSPQHAVMRISPSAEIQVLDQLSENGTTLIRGDQSEAVHLSGDKGVVGHGDTIKFGNRSFHVCLVSRPLETAPE